MSTLSVPLTPALEEFINRQVQSGQAANKADVVRRALISFTEEQAVQDVLKAMREPTIRGDIRDLIKKIS